MSKKESKKNVILNVIKRIIIVGIFLASAVVILIYAKNYERTEIKDKINLIINNNNVTARLKNDVFIENDDIYLSLNDVKNFFDKYIYLEEEIDQVVTTYDSKIATIGFKEKTLTLNGEKKQIYATAIKKDNIIYLPISEMLDVYNIEIKNIESTEIVTIDSLNREQIKANVTKNISVKGKKTILSRTLDKIKRGDSVIVISKDEKGWAKVRTTNGKIGYIKTDKLTNETKVRDNLEEKTQITSKVNMYWEYFSNINGIPDMSGKSFEGVNVVSPSFFYIDENGNFKERVGNAGQEYIKWAHSNGYKVWPMVSNAESKIDTISSIMNSFTERQNLIENILNVCLKYNLDGINIDFENMKKDDKQKFSRFIIELEPRMAEIGLVTTVDVTAPDGDENWSLCYDRNVIGDVADYIVFMAYDQYGNSSNKAGTTAGFNWIETNINKFIKNEEVDSKKIILGIPFYTRIWTETQDGTVSSKPVAMKDVDSIIPDGVERKWDDNLKQYYIEYTSGKLVKKMWIEDEKSITAKVSLVSTYKLAGTACWARGREKENIWSVIKTELQK